MAARICLHRLHLNPSQSSVLLPSRPFRPHPRSRSAITALPALRCCSEMSRKLQPAGAAAASSFASISSFSSEGSASQPEWNEKRSNMSQGMWEYVNRVGVRESPVLQRCRRETLEKLGTRAINQISPDEGQLLQWIVAALGVRQAIEIGVFTGYSALCIASHLPEDGRLIACDVDEKTTRLAMDFWKEAGVDDKIDLRIGKAGDTLDKLLESPENEGAFDLVFIDADKSSYRRYYEQALRLLRKGGVILIDNVFWKGRVIDPEDNRASTKAIRELNEFVHQDERVQICMVPVADGLTMALKR